MEKRAKRFPIGVQDFEKLRTGGCVYVDKTEIIYRLVNDSYCYFLSRPRRFGKSLLISTLDAYFSGRRELFGGLAISKLEEEWTKYPVLHLDLNTGEYDSVDSLKEVLNNILKSWERDYGLEDEGLSPAIRFMNVIKKAYEKTGEKVVILVDEYDKPLLNAVANKELLAKYRSLLKAFYSNLKTQDRYIKFAFLTGVTRFSKVSVFSDLNNLRDISMDVRYPDICGITEQELHGYFDDDVERLAAVEHITKEQCYEKLKREYDGYHFENNTPGVYNPFSLLNCFAEPKFGRYWFSSGTPSFLVHVMKHSNYDLRRLQEEEASCDELSDIDSVEGNPVAIIYQCGYLTIKGKDEKFGMYRLGFPNREVEYGFIKYLLPMYTPVEKYKTEFFVVNFVRDIEAGKAEQFMQRMQTMFASGDYRIVGDAELYFQNAMYVVFKMLGFYVQPEVVTANRRIDAVMQTDEYIYIIEIKLEESAGAAMQQIEEKGYAEPYKMDKRKKFLIGVNFSLEKRGIEKWIIKEYL